MTMMTMTTMTILHLSSDPMEYQQRIIQQSIGWVHLLELYHCILVQSVNLQFIHIF